MINVKEKCANRKDIETCKKPKSKKKKIKKEVKLKFEI